MVSSVYQEAVYSHIKHGKGNAVVEAVAGSGKSSTIIDGLDYTEGRVVFLAFNKHIQLALQARAPEHVQCKTFHGLCFAPVTRASGVRQVNERKLFQLIDANLNPKEIKLYGSFVRRLVSLAKNAGVGVLCPISEEALFELVNHQQLELEHDEASESDGIEIAVQLLKVSNESSEVDFDDLLYRAVLNGVKLPQFDWVFVDEAQDTNVIQRAILRKILDPKRGRLIAVGDSAQAIYGWRGADSRAMDLIADEFAPCVKLPLSVTYRCPVAVVELAKTYVPEILPRADAPAGEVADLGTDWKLTDLGAHDLVVCRNNKPLAELGYRLLKAKIPCRILGKDFGAGLKTLARNCNEGCLTVDELEARVAAWRDRESQKALAKKLYAKVETVEDKADTLLLLLDVLAENERSYEGLVKVLDQLFTDQNSRVTLSTIHKAKGLEAKTVWWLAKSLCPSRWARLPWQQQQEANIQYVAITRASERLVMIELPKKGLA